MLGYSRSLLARLVLRLFTSEYERCAEETKFEKGASKRNSHTGLWPQDHKDRCEFLGKLGVGMETMGCICKACTTSIIQGTKMHMEEVLSNDYSPRWCKGRSKKVVCCILSCSTEARVTNHSFSWDVICTCLGVTGKQIHHGLPLCQALYAYTVNWEIFGVKIFS